MVFVSHETYTPARGGSAQAEVDALRHVFGADADAIVVANTKGFTGHAMGVGIEDVARRQGAGDRDRAAGRQLQGGRSRSRHLNLSKGGRYPVRYALRLGAGFGSQISMTLMRWSPDRRAASAPRPTSWATQYRVIDTAPVGRLAARGQRLRRRPRLEIVQTHAPGARRGPRRPAPTHARLPRQRPRAAPAPAAARPLTSAEPAAAPPRLPLRRCRPRRGQTGRLRPSIRSVTRVLEIVAAQTGYPPDMLDLDLDLEADLGIDTVKQAETFAAIREEYDIERDDNLALRDYPTLTPVIGFVRDRATGLPDPRHNQPPQPHRHRPRRAASGHRRSTAPAAELR